MSTTADDLEAVLARLSPQQRRFVEGICVGMTGVEAARFAGSRARDNAGLAVFASRWRGNDDVRDAIALLREQHALDETDLWDLTVKAIRELLADKSSPNARAKACELMARLLGKVQPDRHLHAHVHAQASEIQAQIADLVTDPVIGPLLQQKARLPADEWRALGTKVRKLVAEIDPLEATVERLLRPGR